MTGTLYFEPVLENYASEERGMPFFFFGATAPVWALAYLHETLRLTSGF
jgi:hypothetical protein